jgi:GWxTD domain-containing protein
MSRKKAWLGILTCLLILAPLAAGDKMTLPERHKKWLEEEVPYIITSRERDIFLKLRTDRERDVFIQAFWNQRDPTRGTPDNEFKAEHYRRLAYANKFFKRGTPRPGWMTDQGRIHIILGPPRNIESYDHVLGVHPTQVWFYQTDPDSGLPPAFNVIFFKKEGLGEYILYTPLDYGPQALIADPLEGFRDEWAAYSRLLKLEPNLARQTLSLIPSENVQYGGLSLASNMLLKNISAAPQKKVDDAYAEALLRYKDSIEVEYTANYIGCDAQAQVFRSENGPFVVHFSVEPKRLSLNDYQGTHSTTFDLNGRLSDSSGRTVYQFDKEFRLSLTAAEVESVRKTALAIQDMFPCLPGRYTFDLLIKNTFSKEFATYEVGLIVPSPSEAGPFLGAPLLAYGLEPSPAGSREEVPFRIAGKQAVSQAQKIFTPQDTLFLVFQVFNLPANWGPEGRVQFIYDKEGKTVLVQPRSLAELRTGETIIEAQPLTAFLPGYYDLTIALLDPAGLMVRSQKEHFEVSHAGGIPRPRILAKVLKPENRADWDYALGLQSLNQGAFEEGRAFLEKAYTQDRTQTAFVMGYAQSLFFLKDYGRVRDVLGPLLKREDAPPDVYALLGRSSHALGQYREAIDQYQEYLARAGTNLEILNLVGTCYFQMGDRAAALATWRKSLDISPKQDQIRKLVDSLTQK